jgi:hypothetical protein
VVAARDDDEREEPPFVDRNVLDMQGDLEAEDVLDAAGKLMRIVWRAGDSHGKARAVKWLRDSGQEAMAALMEAELK